MENDEELLSAGDTALYRTCVGKLLYDAHNQRGDVQFCVKELSRHVSSPTERDLRRLRRVARYCKGAKHLVSSFPRSGLCDSVKVYVDSDWAGCSKGADGKQLRSTSGCVIQVGQCTLHTHSRTQQTWALSSGEAEYLALTAGVAEALLLRDVLRSVQYGTLKIYAYSDSSAARGIASRRGVGRVKHLELRELWLQDLVSRDVIKPRKIASQNNPADLLTKEVDTKTLITLRPCLGLVDPAELGSTDTWAVEAVQVKPAGLSPRVSPLLAKHMVGILIAMASALSAEGSRDVSVIFKHHERTAGAMFISSMFYLGTFLWCLVPVFLLVYLGLLISRELRTSQSRTTTSTPSASSAEPFLKDCGDDVIFITTPYGQKVHMKSQCPALQQTPSSRVRQWEPCSLCCRALVQKRHSQ